MNPLRTQKPAVRTATVTLTGPLLSRIERYARTSGISVGDFTRFAASLWCDSYAQRGQQDSERLTQTHAGRPPERTL